jgi:hypothetical protein
MFATKHAFPLCGLVAAAAIAAIGTGCQQPRPVTPEADQIPLGEFPNITLMRIRSDELAAERPIVTPAAGRKPMQISVSLRSLCEYPIMAEYRYVFYDQNMVSVTMSPTWREVVFGPLQRQILTANSISEKATNWSLEVRRR